MKTAQTNDLPAVWLLSDSPHMAGVFKTALMNSGLQVVDEQVGKNAYKNLLVLTGGVSKTWLQHQLTQLASSPLPTVVVMPILDLVENSRVDYWKTAYQANQRALQAVVAHLPAAKLILIKDWVTHSLDVWYSQPTLCAAGVSSLSNRMPVGLLHPIETAEVAGLVITYVSQPHSSRSVVVRGKPISTTQFVGQVVKLYESYYRVSVETVLDGEILPSKLSFTFQEAVVSTDAVEIARLVARSLPAPGQQINPGIFDWDASEAPKNSKTFKNNQKESKQSEENTLDGDAGELHPEKLFSQLDTLFVDRRTQTKTTQVQNLATHEKKGSKKNHRRKSFFWLGAVSSGVAMALLAVAGTFLLSSTLLHRSFFSQLELFATNQTTGQIEPDEAEANNALARFVQWQLEYLSQLIDSPRLEETQAVLLAKQRLSSVTELSRRQSELRGVILAHLAGVGQTNVSQVASDLLLLTNRRLTEIGELKAATDGMAVDQDWWQGAADELENTIEQQRKQSTYLTQLLPILPTALGVDEPRTYALLFLDSSEIRPTGGFIQAVAILTMEDGRIVASRVLSSYEIDEKLGGLVEPPPELARVLGEEAWYFRDSNWDANHDVAAERVSWFLEKSLGVQVDGVISVPSPAFASLLEAAGPMSVPEFNEMVTAENLGERLLFYNEASATTSKQSFPVALLQSFIANLPNLPPEKMEKLIESLVTQLERANIQVSLFSSTENEPLQALRWTGSLVKPTCPPQFAKVPCSIDYIYQVESNVGINKVNPFVTREIKHTSSLENGYATHERSTVLKNNAKSNAWPQGSYRAYVKWLLPAGAQLLSVKIDNQPVGREVVFSSTENGLSVHGVMVEVPIQSERDVVISYRSPVSTALPHSYLLFDQKQPGLSTSNHLVVISRADEGQPTRVAPEPLIEGDGLAFDFDRSSHSLVLVEYN